MDKLRFLQEDYLECLKAIPENEPAVFGKMNVHQMIEHMSYAFQQASGLIPIASQQDDETTAKMYRFMMSDKPFRDNTPNPFLPNEPEPAKLATIADSIDQLRKDIEVFTLTFEQDPIFES